MVSACLIPTGAIWSNYIKAEVDHKILLSKCNLIIYIFTSVMIGIVCYIASNLYVDYINNQYKAIVTITAIFIFYFPVKYLNVLFELFKIKSGNAQLITRVRVLAALLNVIMNIAFIPIYGAIGAAITTLSVEFFVFFVFIFIHFRSRV
jgi:O-antigen/teichoic acid export membrane protein